MNRRDFAMLPGAPFSGGHLYVAQLTSGVVKVGSTRNPRLRMESLHDKFRRERRPGLARVAVADIGDAYPFRWEAELIRRVHRVGNRVRGREWYADIAFGQAVTMLKQVQRAAVAATKQSEAAA